MKYRQLWLLLFSIVLFGLPEEGMTTLPPWLKALASAWLVLLVFAIAETAVAAYRTIRDEFREDPLK